APRAGRPGAAPCLASAAVGRPSGVRREGTALLRRAAGLVASVAVGRPGRLRGPGAPVGCGLRGDAGPDSSHPDHRRLRDRGTDGGAAGPGLGSRCRARRAAARDGGPARPGGPDRSRVQAELAPPPPPFGTPGSPFRAALEPGGSLVAMPAILPIVLLRAVYGRVTWHAPATLANLTIDDPALRQGLLGLRWDLLLAQARDRGFHTTIATVPRELAVADPAVVE